MMSMPSSLIGFAIFKALSEHLSFPFTPVENGTEAPAPLRVILPQFMEYADLCREQYWFRRLQLLWVLCLSVRDLSVSYLRLKNF